MTNQINKPKLSPRQLIEKMRDEKGITFNLVSEDEAEEYLADVNNYFRVAAYRKNCQKHAMGKNKGKYINLDFAYLQELSAIDMHLRFLLNRMCSDIEHSLKVQLIRDICCEPDEDGYTIVKQFIDSKPHILEKLNRMSTSPFTGDLLCKYFTVQQSFNSDRQKHEKQIKAYDDCPIWVLCEFLSFGDVIRLYEFFYEGKDTLVLSRPVLNLVRNLRNAAAHNNCILANLRQKTHFGAPKEIKNAMQSIRSKFKGHSKEKLSCSPMLELVALFYVYSRVVTGDVRRHRIGEVRELFFNRMIEKKSFFEKNDSITSNYEFICKIIEAFL